MLSYLSDIPFLEALSKEKLKIFHGKIIILSFDSEQPIIEIQGKITGGTLSINGNSSVRRTISLTMIADNKNNQLTNLDNIISLNKKIKILVGYENNLKDYQQYGKIIWFPCGVYLISQANISIMTNKASISISGQDKMTLLNGVAGGTLSALTNFDTSYTYKEDGSIIQEKVKIINIIKEVVNHLGKEPLTNIFINDLEDTARRLIKYSGTTPIHFSEDYSSFIICNDTEKPDNFIYTFYQNDDIGYMETDFYYPSDLTFEAGSTLTQVLDKICQFLGNYEYFYDVFGHFIFQEIKNYLNTTYSLTDSSNYIKSFSNSKYLYTLNNSNLITSIVNSPKYDNIKNDFIVWGNLDNTSETKIRYHLVIDQKPKIDLANKFMWEKISSPKQYYFTDLLSDQPDDTELIGKKSNEWREELYRQALVASLDSLRASDYDIELLAEWRKIYDTVKWEDGWNPSFKNDPQSITYWLDFIDSSSTLGQYSVKQIGRRSKIISDSSIHTLFNQTVPDVIFIKNPENQLEISEIINKYNTIGQKFCFFTANQENYFTTSSTGASAYDKIRELLYQHLIYNIQISISMIPCYYLEPNNLIYINNKESNVNGDFVINTLSIPLNYNGNMTITATENFVRI